MNQAHDKGAGPEPSGLMNTLLHSALRSAVKAGDALNVIEKAAGLSISLGVSREVFVESVGHMAGLMYDAAAQRRQRADSPPAKPG